MGKIRDALARLGQLQANRQARLVTRAMACARSNRYTEAVALVRRAYPFAGEAWLRETALGDVSTAAGKHAEAAGHYLNGMKANPQARPAFRKYLNAARAAHLISEAEVELRRLMDESPGNPNPRNYWAVMLHLNGRTAEAQRFWQEVIASWPKYSPAHSNLGYAYQVEGKLDKAILEYKLAIELEPDNAIAAYNNLAELYMGRGDFGQAIGLLERATRLEGYLSVPYATLGHCYSALGRIDEAIAAYLRSLECEPGVTTNDTRLEVLNQLAKLYLGRQELDKAKDACEQALARASGNPDALTILGQVLFHLGNYQEAVEVFREALNASPMSLRNLLIHKHLALTYYKMGHFDRAAAEYKRANSWYPDHLYSSNLGFSSSDGRKAAEDLVARCKADLLLRPQDPELHSRMGDGYLHLGCVDEAIQGYRAAVDLLPGEPELLCKLGMAHFANDQSMTAVQSFSRAVELNPGYAPAHIGLGLTHLRAGSVDTAIIKFQWALAINQDSPEAHNFLGNALRQKGELDQAVAEYQQAIRSCPEYAQAHNNLGRALLDSGRHCEAVAAFRRAVEILPDYVPALCNLGRALKAIGEDADARRVWQQALKINPSNPVAQELLQQEFSEAAAGSDT